MKNMVWQWPVVFVGIDDLGKNMAGHHTLPNAMVLRELCIDNKNYGAYMLSVPD